MPSGQLVRSKNDRMIAGVCGGLAQWLGWDPTAMRILYLDIDTWYRSFDYATRTKRMSRAPRFLSSVAPAQAELPVASIGSIRITVRSDRSCGALK